MIGNILWYYEQATPDEKDQGMGWYADQHQRIVELANIYDYPVDVVAAVTAVLSPRIAWSRNLIAAATLLDAVNRQKNLEEFTVDGLGMSKYKAFMIANTWDDRWVRGDKVTAFYNNLKDPDASDRVTVDTWTYRVAMNELGKGRTPSLTAKLYDLIEDAYVACS